MGSFFVSCVTDFKTLILYHSPKKGEDMLDKRLNQIVEKYPQTMDYFNKINIDYCCNGDDSLEFAIQKNSYNKKEILKELEACINKNEKTNISLDDFKKENIEGKFSHIKNIHHDYERKLLEDIDELLRKILLVHFKKHGQDLKKTYLIFVNIKASLLAHLAKEEKEVFPIFEKDYEKKDLVFLDELKDEHKDMGEMLEKLKISTNNFKAPKDGCKTYELSFDKLKSLTEDIYLHIFKENSIIFKNLRNKFL